MDRHTALYERHAQLGANFTDFGGWQMPLRYDSELAEHRAVREAAGLFDLSHMGEVWLTGPQAADALNYALVGKFSAMRAGKAKYSLILAEDGGIIDDLIVYRLPDGETDRFLVVPNAGNAGVVAAELTARAAGFDVTVTDASADTALIAIQGPRASSILLRTVATRDLAAVEQLGYYAALTATLVIAGAEHEVLVARTGYTGEDGFELIVPNALAPALWDELRTAGGDELVPAGLASRDSLRLEAGMPLYGNELGRDVSPFAVGLGGVVAFGKDGDFVGRAALEAARDLGVGTTTGRTLVGLRGLGRRAARAHYPVLQDGVVVGEVTSGLPSPTLGYPIALASVDVAAAAECTALEVDLRGKTEPVVVVPTPFYRRSS